MRILHVGLCVDGKNEGLPFALKEAASFYYEVRPDKMTINDDINKALTHDFDLAFFQIQSPGVVHPFLFQKIKDKGIFTLNWSGDIRNGTPEWFFKTGVDLTCFSNDRDVSNMRAKGLKADFLQIGIDPKVYNKHNSNEPGNDIVYMGNNYRNQFPEGQARMQMNHLLKSTYGNRFSLYGNGWGESSGENNADQLRQSKIYNNSKIGINYSQFRESRYTSDRMFRILGSGCFCLSHYYPGIEHDFEVGKHLDTFSNFNEMKVKINHYLSNHGERERIAQNGYDLCHSRHTYKHMVNDILELYKKYK